ncbi:DUF262 domain-containing protein [Paenibacillus sp. W2I17]|uniref:DUF262 domain-containing protein n=1 Tax=Paenibacillus sp. W2I17 TaxID=3042311 RepID=UPI00278676AF|nr:DUF262 domain-containing protein [Paenibacillus sp. W2I17]MDQ0659479.1 hypothetical protein [Paenibacillus sp. W2I17]
MRLMPSDPDISTIVNRIIDGDINLQPNFQRGEVWGDTKKIRLIDSILRDWHVPPIHVVEIKESGRQDVLDGQQRLVAIRDFVNGLFSIDGTIEPINDEILKLDGIKYNQLPPYWKRKFDKFTIRVYSITDYLPSEPGELFYRLNQPTNLTSAEQRNAFYGPAREQVKMIVDLLAKYGLTKREIGFSNSRMAYDDVVARLCLYLDAGMLRDKITASILADKFRDEDGFTSKSINRAEHTVIMFSKVVGYFDENIKFNKATLLSWLLFLTRVEDQVIDDIGRFIYSFEKSRNTYISDYRGYEISINKFLSLYNIFSDRSSSRVADVSSVLIRDVIIWINYYIYSLENNHSHLIEQNSNLMKIKDLINLINNNSEFEMENILLNFIEFSGWGKSI